MNTYKSICLMIPTYHRVDRLRTIIDSVFETLTSDVTVRFSFCVNVNDHETRDFIHKYLGKWCYEIIDENTIQPNLSLYFNLMYDNTKFKDSVVTMIGDDMVFKTKGWDTRILKEINDADGKLILFCDDDYVAHEKCCVQLFTTREVVEPTKKPFMCTHFHADMIDMIWFMVGKITGLLKYLPDVIIQHNHSTKQQKEEWDLTFQRLAPIQQISNKNEGVRLAVCYATLCARNMIESGVGSWNTLQ